MDPKDMTDEQLQTVITTGVEPEVEEPKEVVPEVETPAEVVETPPIVEDEPEEPVATAPVVEEERPPSRRESLRIQQLIDRMKQTAPEPKAQAPRNDALDYATALDADPEVIRQLEADRTAASDASYNAGLGNILAAQTACGGRSKYDEIIRCLPKITGENSRETITYIERIAKFWSKMAPSAAGAYSSKL